MQFTAVFFWLFAINAQASESSVLLLNEDIEPVNPAPFVTYLVDAEGTLSAEDTIQREFSPLPNNAIDFGFTRNKFWLRLSVLNTGETAIEPIFRTSARFMRPLEIYLVRNSGNIEKLLYNDETLPFGERPLPELRFLATSFSLDANEEATFLIKFGAGGQASMTFQISDREAALNEQSRASIGISIYTFILLTLLLVNFFHYLAVRKLAYLAYVFYESFNILYVSHMEGFTFQYLWPNLPQWNDDATPIIAATGIIVGNFFAMIFLEAKKYTPKLYRVFLLFIGISTIALLVTLVFGNRVGNQLTAPMLPISLVLCVVVAAIALHKGHYLARYFMVAWAFFLVSAAFWSGNILGLFEINFNILTVYKITVAAQAIILSMGLADQVRHIYNENINTQAELIANLEGRLEDARDRLRLEHENETAMQQLLDKSKQLANTSHDINQPLQSLRLALKALSKKSEPDTIEHLENTLDHMESILGGTLDGASKDLQSSMENSAIQSLVLGSLFEDLKHHFSHQATTKGLVLRFFNSKIVAVTRLSPLKRCLMNLISNAINNTEQGSIFIGARRRGDRIDIQVLDTGKGIEKEQIEAIQQPLNKGIDSRGHGLGLAIVFDICTEYDWQLSINSAVNKGSSFTVSIPIRV